MKYGGKVKSSGSDTRRIQAQKGKMELRNDNMPERWSELYIFF
jgi:hypothetical protein